MILLKIFLDQILEFLFPSLCLLCSQPAHEPSIYFCEEHFNALRLIKPPFCFRCGHPLPIDFGSKRCAFCRGNALHFTRSRSAALYRDSARELILAWKLRHQKVAVYPLSDLLLAALKNEDWLNSIDLLCFVPLHKKKQKERGFNQAEELARELSRFLKKPIFTGLHRVRETLPQGSATNLSRDQNVKDAFSVRRPKRIERKNLLLLDDVYTSGATVSECAKVLKAAGARRVYVATVARGGVQGDFSLPSPQSHAQNQAPIQNHGEL